MTEEDRAFGRGSRRTLSIFPRPEPAALVLARALSISADEARLGIVALVEAGYGIGPREPTNGMLVACLEALTPPKGHEAVVTALSKARVRWQAMLAQGTAMSLSRKFIPAGPVACDAPIPASTQEGEAK